MRDQCLQLNIQKYFSNFIIQNQQRILKLIMSKQNWKQLSQSLSTQCDSSSDRDQEISYVTPKTNPLKHKTQLCKTYSELGYCNYGEKCRFAHGKHELIRACQNKTHRDRKCKGYWQKGVCLYGIRCQFGHFQKEWNCAAYLGAQKSLLSSKNQFQQSRLLRLL